MNECTGCRRIATSQYKCKHCRGTGNEPKIIVATVYACPRCGGYYGSSSMPALEQSPTFKVAQNEPQGTRDRCADCGETRIRCQTIVKIPIRGDYEGEIK